jgi:hypothetical protein
VKWSVELPVAADLRQTMREGSRWIDVEKKRWLLKYELKADAAPKEVPGKNGEREEQPASVDHLDDLLLLRVN